MAPDLRELSPRAVDCLKLVYKLSERGERVTTSAMRERLAALEPSGQLSDASVTQLFKWLSEHGYLRHTPYRGVELTEEGERLALELTRHHRLLELFLTQIMGYSWDMVDAEAERLEHVISEEFEERMDALLGHPTVDPHGDPIPSKSGMVTMPATLPLSELGPGDEGIVLRVNDDDAEQLRYLTGLGIARGTRLRVVARDPFGGPLWVCVGDDMTAPPRAIGPQLAAGIRVGLTEHALAGK
ncbi:MAG: metal-dependent transcriptional regulator [Chloroflexota bacterium]|nr:metal-dependent transcriptional regulator [Chloroflexota bacterium]